MDSWKKMESNFTSEITTRCPRMSPNTWRKCRKVTSFQTHHACLRQSRSGSTTRRVTSSANSWTNHWAEGTGVSRLWVKKSRNSKSKHSLDLKRMLFTQVLAGLSGKRNNRHYTRRTRLQTLSRIWMHSKKSLVRWWSLLSESRANWLEKSSIRRRKKWKRSSLSCSTWVSLLTFKLKFPKTPLVKRTFTTPWDRRLRPSFQLSSITSVESLAWSTYTACTTGREELIWFHLMI